MIALVLAGGVSLVVALVATPLLTRWLFNHNIGQQIREDGPERHVTKAGTPTMGGICIIGAALTGYAVAHVRGGTVFTRAGLIVMAAIVGAGVVGMLDDWIKVRHQRSLGLNKRTKIIGQLLVAGSFAVVAAEWAGVRTALSFTRYDAISIDLGTAVWTALAIFMVVATTNAVNLTDGLDGLAAGSSAFSFSCFVIVGFWQFRHPRAYGFVSEVTGNTTEVIPLDLALIAVAMMGACAGFLWWNAPPASVFMGDTGSLAIGAALATLTLCMNVHLLLPIAGGLFVLETLSVIVQVASFRMFHTRVFKMAPIHHHFELMGWPETTVLIRFWILSGLATAAALGLFYADFLTLGISE